jgi:hypothetical protein
MHMRGHGEEYKTAAALAQALVRGAKPYSIVSIECQQNVGLSLNFLDI